MSSVLFNIYIDDLSSALNDSISRRSLNGVLCNHLMYADDTCIITHSQSALFKLLKICTQFAKDNTIICNRSKSKYMCFKAKSLSNLLIPDMY